MNWETNLNFLTVDPYRFNAVNRIKFATRFLKLPHTQILLKLRERDIARGIDMARYNLKPIYTLEKLGFLKLRQVSPKLNKKYEISITESGAKTQEDLRSFIKYVYPQYVKNLESLYSSLQEFGVIEDKFNALKGVELYSNNS